MSLEEILIRQRDFSAGEVDPDAIRRDDTDALRAAVRYARNLVSRHTGGLTQRPGRRFLFQDDGVIFEFKPFDDISYRVVFIAGGVRIRTEDGALVASLSAPWTAADLDSLVWEPDENEIFVCWSGRTQVIDVSPTTGTWTIKNYDFSTGIDGAVRVPFFRFSATTGVTLQPSAVSGNITVTFSANILNSQHVGTIFRYAGRQLRITSVTNAKKGNATVLEKLPSTFIFNVDSSDGFSVGQTVETDTTNVKAEVIAVATGTVTAVAITKLTTPQNGEKLVGPTSTTKINSFSVTTPGATVQWDEQFISNYRGWPRSVSKDRQRLIFTNFGQLKNAVCWSATGDNRDFEVGAEPDDAMLETIDAECQVFHVAGGYDEFALTDKGVFYIPVSVGTPLQPGSVEFRIIFSSELANIRPIQVTEGVIFVDKSMNGLYAISATGQTARPYIPTEANRLHRHLFDGVKSIAVSSATSVFPSRQIYAVNADGTVVVGQFNSDSEYIGWLKWDGEGEVRSVTGTYGKVVFMTRYTINGVVTGVAEELDYDLLFDCAIPFDGGDVTDFLELNDGSALTLKDGQPLTIEGFVTQFYAGQEVSIYADGFYFGEVTVPATGIISGFADYSEVIAGIRFDWVLRPLFINFDGGQPVGQAEQRRKIEKMLIAVRETQEFRCGNRIFGSYRGGEDMSVPVPERDDTYRYRELGRSYDPIVELGSTFPCKFKLIELTTRITV
ncbi:hypothetical protein SM0020_12225 [Sinorhizobium meliloti CCNWSX0020]|uniref:Uncharacterized protein n=1 Tax=Sinorhizobium meliloti CCNWSX0020 TaxID=1107881 RepID=H0FZ11_RHIML|nr:hypothetical protein [Sinorhizobium meliloti]EHK77691.1 hypothetical protein SM0020_12225 [Sinorhizobium meliloti CCNWSX0020]